LNLNLRAENLDKDETKKNGWERGKIE
jgi:hypothetical protein